MVKQYVLSQQEYDEIQAELQKAITSNDLSRKQFCLRLIAIKFDMYIIGGMTKDEEASQNIDDGK